LAGIVGNSLVGPYVFPHQLTGDHYWDLLNGLPSQLKDESLVAREYTWFMHDGAPPHFSRDVPNVLNSTYHNKCIGRGRRTAWPPQSPDLNPLDFYVWRHLKSFVCSDPLHNVDTLHHHIMNACQAICNYPWDCNIKSPGGHFEHQ
jgi:hypothetical protein